MIENLNLAQINVRINVHCIHKGKFSILDNTWGGRSQTFSVQISVA